MVNRIDHNISRDVRTSQNSSNNRSASRIFRLNITNIDDVIASLANAPENKRARQVTEWEKLRRQSFRVWA